MTNFPLLFGLALVVNVSITLRSSELWRKSVTGRGDTAAIVETKEEAQLKKEWESVLKKYMAVYLLATLSDWLQGPYVYALYSDYGYSQHEIAVLFVAGFGSSMVFGSFIGGMADWGGRRTFVVLYAVVYAASCVTKRALKSGSGNVCSCALLSFFLTACSFLVSRIQISRASRSSCWVVCWEVSQHRCFFLFSRPG